MQKVVQVAGYMLLETPRLSSKFQSGFTFIEILVVISTLAILSTIGIASFVNYSRTQALNSAAFDVITTFNQAKSRSRTQVKPPSGNCSILALDGYLVRIEDAITYSLEIMCEGSSYPVSDGTKKLPNGSTNTITFSSDSRGKTFLFKILSGSVQIPGGLASDTVIITGYGQTKTITIHSNGKIGIQ